ncbi:MAG: hypothetical protein ACXAB2_01935 [Candidatus Hodarchaeales archaeon]
MFQNQAETIFVSISDEVKAGIVKESAKWSEKETGGMLFGTVEESEVKLTISISKVFIPPEETAIRKSTYFEIEPTYAREILDSEPLLYLGNWHKHLGFGGPSHGDHSQIGNFFQNNPHRNTILTLIIDFLSEDDYNIILEVYRRKEEINEDIESSLFIITPLQEKNLPYDPIHTLTSVKSSSEKGISEKLIALLKQTIIMVYSSVESVEDIHHLEGSLPDEKIISFPYRFSVEQEDNHQYIDLRVLVSFPPTFPYGDIFIDLSSHDLSRKFTIQTYPASFADGKEQIQPFLELLQTFLEEKAQKLLEDPLWKIMRDLS